MILLLREIPTCIIKKFKLDLKNFIKEKYKLQMYLLPTKTVNFEFFL